jgi:hypothetical protein
VSLLEQGVPLEEVSKLLGHESIKTTKKYYAKWVKARQDRLDAFAIGTWATEIEARHNSSSEQRSASLDASTSSALGLKRILKNSRFRNGDKGGSNADFVGALQATFAKRLKL